MSDLATRIEQAQPGQEREVLGELFVAIRGRPPFVTRLKDGDLGADDPLYWRFTRMLDAEAWLSAVEMLVPEGWQEWQVGRQSWKGCNGLAYVLARGSMRNPLLVHAATPALALAAAIARSIGHG